MDLSHYRSGVSESPPSAPDPAAVGYPTGGDPSIGAAPTTPGAYWYWQIQAEVAALLTAAGVTPDAGNLTQLRDALFLLMRRPGEIIWIASTTAPAGSLVADGSAVSVSTYARLSAVLYCGDSANADADWGYRCTGADGTGRSTSGSYIVLPDLRGQFVRGFDAGRGIDAGRTLHAAQACANLEHGHSYALSEAISVAYSSDIDLSVSVAVSTEVSVSGQYGYERPYIFDLLGLQSGGSSVYVPGLETQSGTVTSTGTCAGTGTGTGTATVAGTGTGTLTASGTTGDSGGTESRPVNLALLACIVY